MKCKSGSKESYKNILNKYDKKLVKKFLHSFIHSFKLIGKSDSAFCLSHEILQRPANSLRIALKILSMNRKKNENVSK